MTGKLYLFGIGGTGARVVKSIVMLAASGVDIPCNSIVPIIIDPDFANADLTRTIDQLKTYSEIRSKIDFNSSKANGFFKTPILEVVPNYCLTLQDTKNNKFKDFIQYSTLDIENMALASMLFSKENLDSDMEVGFKGNPNIGSVVLNQFTTSSDFTSFAASFNPGDRIFIISSIFGGTGASGFPLLLKNIRSASNTIPNFDAIKNAPIGAVSVLPYFDIRPAEKGVIDSSSFLGKTKAALKYYEKNISGDKSSSNILYYIGDNQTNQYEYSEGGASQTNKAHFVEMAAALSAIDFATYADNDPAMTCSSDNFGRVYSPQPKFKEFGIDNDSEQIIFSDLYTETKDQIICPLTQFTLMSKYALEHLKNALGIQWAKDSNFDSTYIKSTFIQNLNRFSKSFIGWLTEMAENKRSFKPLNINIKDNDLFSIVEGIKPAKIYEMKAMGKSGYDLVDTYLNSSYKNLSKDLTQDQKFIELFYIVTKELVEKKYRF